jgi:formylglycine-generating enzyme required for sulfatase activity
MLEWVLDWYAADWYAKDGAGCWDCANLTAAAYRVLRGGYWRGSPCYLRAAARGGNYPDDQNIFTGFRCARSAP